ncbi:uncharacterized protein L3040_009250 [Drepanopeziza brunnea f. sp. 'multigermtubi']|uniref:uncharacterized protein n=1 Tax=Drepanopeziza brunnea f. sp. 'multigermtubi' TaxID=698441 RepID=UPI0023A78D38|nr:hypothetical protein L3040_009250 [Drepanopeziza brunnea f. sp. 'multigermtubi']
MEWIPPNLANPALLKKGAFVQTEPSGSRTLPLPPPTDRSMQALTTPERLPIIREPFYDSALLLFQLCETLNPPTGQPTRLSKAAGPASLAS